MSASAEAKADDRLKRSPGGTGAGRAALARQVQVGLVGLMTMAPLSEDPEAARPTFRGLRDLRDELRQAAGDPAALPELSMGMSGDFAVAIEEGATMVRVGSRLFEGLGDS